MRVGVIGTGMMGLNHLRVYNHLSSVELVAFSECNADRRLNIENTFSINGYADYRDLVGKVDAVSIASPTITHKEIATYFLENQVHVLLEKPITAHIQEAKELIKIAKDNQVVLAIGHIERFNPVVKEMKEIIKTYAPIYIDIHRESPFDSRIYDVDVVSDLMIHDIDLLFYLLQQKINIKSSQGIKVHSDKNDIVNVQLISEEGIIINVTTSRATEQKVREWRVISKECLIEADLLERKLFLTKRTNLLGNFDTSQEQYKYIQEQMTAKILVGHYEPLQLEIEDFISSIINKHQPVVSGMDGLHALEMVTAIQNAAH